MGERGNGASGQQPGPALVLLHGTRMSARQWGPYRDLLPGVELVAVDLPGHGERVGEEFTENAVLQTVGDAVSRAARQGVPRPVLVGHSLGGYVATLWAARHPGTLGALVLVGATADPAGPMTGVYRWFARLVPRIDADRLATRMNTVMRWIGAKGEHADVLPDGAAYAALPAAWELVMESCGPDLLEDVDCPVVMVNGQFDQMRLHVTRFEQRAREAHVETIPRATHLLPATHPEALAAVLRRVVDLAR